MSQKTKTAKICQILAEKEQHGRPIWYYKQCKAMSEHDS